jgi:hypothetical protein
VAAILARVNPEDRWRVNYLHPGPGQRRGESAGPVLSLCALSATAGMLQDVSGTPEQQDLSSVPVACPLCGQVHERCVFTAGSVYCTRPECSNPHHRQPPAAPGPQEEADG